MTPINGSNTGLRKHILLDAARRNAGRIVMVMLFGSTVIFLPTGHFVFDALKPAVILLLIPLLLPDNRLLICLPVSQKFRGQCHWLGYVSGPSAVVVPALAMSLPLARIEPYVATALLTAASTFALIMFVFPHAPKNLPPDTFLQATLPPLLALLILTRFLNHVLYTRFDFPWLFLLLMPLAVVAVFRSYRQAHLLGRLPFRSPFQKPTPEKDSRGRDIRLELLGACIVSPAIGGIITALILLLCQRMWRLGPTAVFMACGMMCVISFGQMASVLFPSLRLLRSLPARRTYLAGLSMMCAVASIALQVLALALLRVLTKGFLPALPLNLVFLWICGSAFLPFLVVFFGRRLASLIEMPVLLLPVIVGLLLVEHERASKYLNAAYSSWFALSAAACLLLAFFLLRYALLHARLDWRYARDAQEMTTRSIS